MTVKERLEYLRSQIRAECISYGEIAELEDLAEHIEPGDVELLQWAGVPEFCECDNTHEAVNTVCRHCWQKGRRKWDDPNIR